MPDHDTTPPNGRSANSAAGSAVRPAMAFCLFSTLVATCATLAGLRLLAPDHQQELSSGQARASTYEYSPQQPKPVATIRLSAGERLIIGSLDDSAGRHELLLTGEDPGRGQNLSANVLSQDSSTSLDFQLVHYTPLSKPANGSAAVREQTVSEGDEPAPSTTGDISSGTIPACARTFRLPWFPRQPNSSRGTQQTADRVVRCNPLCTLSSVRIYGDGCEVSSADIRSLTSALQGISATAGSSVPGEISDVDLDGHLSLVICRLSEDLRDADVPLLGCVRADDFLGNGPLCGDIIYLDTRLLHDDGLSAVLIHEMTHAALFSRIRTLRMQNSRLPLLPAWLNEAIAHSCEYHHCPDSPNLTDRIHSYLSNTGHWPLIPPRRVSGSLSARGPIRAAGLFYVESLREDSCLQKLVDSILLSGHGTPAASESEFAATFRRWTLWMAAQQRAGRLALDLRSLPKRNERQQTVIRGTAATWWQAEDNITVTISATRRSRLQLTVLSADSHRPRSHAIDDDHWGMTQPLQAQR